MQSIPEKSKLKRASTIKVKNSPILKAQNSFNDAIKLPLSPSKSLNPQIIEQQKNFKETLKNELAPRDFSQKAEQRKVWDAIKNIKE